MKDIIFCSIPYSNLDHIYAAPAILKGVALQHGFTASTIDFGVELSKLCNEDKALFYKIQNYFISPGDAELSASELKILEDFFQLVIDFFKQNPSKLIGMSVFSRYTHKSSLAILTRLRAAGVNTPVVVGGRGVGVPILPTVIKDFNVTSMEAIMKFGDLLKRRQLVDTVIHGDGEDAIVQVLKGLPVSDQSYETLMSNDAGYLVAEPDYEDYEFKYYHFEDGNISMPITGSKGCVRDCDFCEIKNQFGNYRYRSGQDVANEMIRVSAKYNVRDFMFNDSLVNGGLRPFREFLTIMSDFNTKNPDKAVTWSGQYICRPSSHMPADLYPMMAKSGAHGITIGAESGSNRVLEAMNKKTTVEALYDEMEQFRANGITAVTLMFVGHWSEHFEDFKDQCRMLINLAPYLRGGSLSGVFLGTPFMINESVPEEITRRINCAPVSGNLVWWMPENPESTFKERIYRRLIIGELCEHLNLPTKDNNTVFQYLSANLSSYHQEINEFYQEQGAPTYSPAQQAFNDFDRFLNELMTENEREHEFEIHVTSQSSNGDPHLEVRVGDEVKFSADLPAGDHVIRFQHQHQPNSPMPLTMEMSGKGEYDTQIDEQGNIIADKNIQFNLLKVNKYDLLVDYDFVRTYGKYQTDRGDTDLKYGLWSNGTITIPFETPVCYYYNTRSTKNRKIGGALSVTDRSYDEEKSLLLTQLKKLI